MLMVSSIAQGKKPATSATTTTPAASRRTSASRLPASTETTKSTPARTDHQTTRPQKRVLPSRSRRGGPGLGSADVDVIILDAQKRKRKVFLSTGTPRIQNRPVGTECVIAIARQNTRVLCAASRLEYSPIYHVDYLV